jgi:hypothetical protein
VIFWRTLRDNYEVNEWLLVKIKCSIGPLSPTCPVRRASCSDKWTAREGRARQTTYFILNKNQLKWITHLVRIKQRKLGNRHT